MVDRIRELESLLSGILEENRYFRKRLEFLERVLGASADDEDDGSNEEPQEGQDAIDEMDQEAEEEEMEEDGGEWVIVADVCDPKRIAKRLQQIYWTGSKLDKINSQWGWTYDSHKAESYDSEPEVSGIKVPKGFNKARPSTT